MTDERMLWAAYAADRSVENRNRLVVHHWSLVPRVHKRVEAVCPPTVSREDLLSAGSMGLITAVEKFNPEQNSFFPSFAVFRIQGAMLDFFRTESRRGRYHGVRMREWHAAESRATAREGRAASHDEIAAEAAPICRDWATEVRMSEQKHLSLHYARTINDDEGGPASIADTAQPDPSARIAASEEFEHLLSLVSRPEDRTTLKLFFGDGLFQEEIARRTGHSQATVSKRIVRGVQEIRQRLQER